MNSNACLPDFTDEVLAQRTLSRRLPELEALARRELLRINLDLHSAAATACAALPQLEALRSLIDRTWRDFDFSLFEQLADYAVLLNYSHNRFLTLSETLRDARAASGRAVLLRQRLLADATALALRGYLDQERVDALHAPGKRRQLADELELLAALFEERWSQVKSKCAVELANLTDARELAALLRRAGGKRARANQTLAEVAELRVRVFTLFFRTYDELRAAVIYLRRQQRDAERIAPSLFPTRRNGRRQGESGRGVFNRRAVGQLSGR